MIMSIANCLNFKHWSCWYCSDTERDVGLCRRIEVEIGLFKPTIDDPIVVDDSDEMFQVNTHKTFYCSLYEPKTK